MYLLDRQSPPEYFATIPERERCKFGRTFLPVTRQEEQSDLALRVEETKKEINEGRCSLRILLNPYHRWFISLRAQHRFRFVFLLLCFYEFARQFLGFSHGMADERFMDAPSASETRLMFYDGVIREPRFAAAANRISEKRMKSGLRSDAKIIVFVLTVLPGLFLLWSFVDNRYIIRSEQSAFSTVLRIDGLRIFNQKATESSNAYFSRGITTAFQERTSRWR